MVFSKRILFILLTLCSSLSAWATHNRAGEITYKHIRGTEYEITVVTYTKISQAADRPKLLVKWGDNSQDSISRISTSVVGPDIRKNIYVMNHIYPGSGIFTISMEDPNRNGNVQNVPNSIAIPFYIDADLVINAAVVPNNSVVLTNPPVDNGCTFLPFHHVPGAYDPDGDSLTFAIIPCRESGGRGILGYTQPPTTGSFSINPASGMLSWISPPNVGEYNIAIEIKEWRNSRLIGRVVRDMQIDIAACNNHPPVLSATRDTCIVAGQKLQLLITARDTDRQFVTLTANGGPFVVGSNRAIFPNNISAIDSISGLFEWTTDCSHVRLQPYQVIFRAMDNGTPPLSDLEIWNIRVIGDAPKGVSAQSKFGKITVSWQPYMCSQIAGFKVYRKEDTSGVRGAHCETGAPNGSGYVLYDTLQRPSATSYVDDGKGQGLSPGKRYCYLITAMFPNIPPFVFTGAESKPSEEACNIVQFDLPILTKASITTTNSKNGQVDLFIRKPQILDTIQFPPPYKFRLEGSASPSFSNLTKLADYSFASFSQMKDFPVLDSNQNTTQQIFYRLKFLVSDSTEVGKSFITTPPFLTSVSLPSSLKLKWYATTGWSNDSTQWFKKNGSTFQYLTTTIVSEFEDTGLVIGQEYCYKVQTFGHFTDSSISGKSINFSQEYCSSPKDTIPPCSPILYLDRACEAGYIQLNWNMGGGVCDSDVVVFRIYYRDKESGKLTLLDTVSGNKRSYRYVGQKEALMGCFSISSVDFWGNESALSDTLCSDNCSAYSLPNTFTPNGDGINDFFEPIENRYIQFDHIEIYNRWGQKIAEITDSDIKWDGGSFEGSGFYYLCYYKEKSLKGDTARLLRGTLRILR